MSLPVPADQTHLTHPKYRGDIDGLRAVAVLSVVAFHAFPQWVRGGFVGVDIFFVISGFLITSIILGSLQHGTFSFAEFYARRIRRIFPALILVMTSCLAFGWFALLPDEYKQLGKHVIGGAGFISNFFFWQEAGYFDNAAETKPLLHLWSLGIEEQFYIVWPLLLYMAWKRKANLLIISMVLVIASFTLNARMTYSDITQAFYSPITRFWELLIGGLLAYLTLHKISLWDRAIQKVSVTPGIPDAIIKIDRTFLSNAQSIAGFLLIGASLFLLIHKGRSFPGWWALFPALGTYLIISAGQHAWLNRKLLSSRLMVWFGLISYPLYLWHWPLLSFARLMESKTPTADIRIIAILIAFVLAWVTFRLFEHPIRFRTRTRFVTISLLILMPVLSGVAYLIYVDDGVSTRIPQDTLTQIDQLDFRQHWSQWARCTNQGNCLILDPTKPASVAVIGDSHATHLASGFAEIYGKAGINAVLRAGNSCLPFYGISDTYCGGIINKALDDSINSDSIRTIILSGYALRHLYDATLAISNEVESDYQPTEPNDRHVEDFTKAMYSTLEQLVASGKRVIYLVDVPELYFDPRECVNLRPIVLPGNTLRIPCSIDRKAFERRNADYHRIVANAKSAFPSVAFIYLYEYLCNSESCFGMIEGKLLYTGYHHLTTTGSRYVARKLATELR
jgi:peptidoglycan/LPS O-acetylase OafA/YrhL